MRQREPSGGYTLLEIMIVVAIMIGLITVGTVGMRRLRHSDLRTAASRLAGAIKYTYDRAITTGKYYRLVIDIDRRAFVPQVSDEKFYLVRGGRHAATQGEDESDENTEAAGKGGASAGAPLGASPPSGAVKAKVGLGKARFTNDMPPDRRQAVLEGVNIAAVWTPRTEEPVTSGRAYLYFFPQGMTERAIIHLTDTSGMTYSLLVHPLTGRVTIRSERVELPRSAEDLDDSGEARP